MSTIISVYSGFNLVDAQQVRGALEEAGIPVFLKNEDTQDLFGIGRIGTGFSLVVGGFSVEVHEENVEKAIEIIENLFPDIEPMESEEE